jgi:hypothetical protein
MMSLIAHDLRVATRQAAWPIALGLHLAGAMLFIFVWGPTNGVPLWSASLLAQLVAADRLLLAVLLTWLVTPLCAPGPRVDLTGWASVAGVSVSRAMAARIAAAGVLAILITVTLAPVVMIAAEIAAAPMSAAVVSLIEMAIFSLAVVGLTAASAAIWQHPLAVWCAGMATTVIAAFGVRLLAPGIARLTACVLVAGIGTSAVVATARRRWLWISERAA